MTFTTATKPPSVELMASVVNRLECGLRAGLFMFMKMFCFCVGARLKAFMKKNHYKILFSLIFLSALLGVFNFSVEKEATSKFDYVCTITIDKNSGIYIFDCHTEVFDD